MLAIWRGARFREERYAALELAGMRRFQAFQTLETLPMYEEMITTGAWWDVVDAIAIHRLGELLRRHPRPLGKAMRAWSRSRNLWKRRSAILCQIALKGRTDLDLLYAASRLRWPRRSSSPARPSAGRCASMPGRTPARWCAT